MKTRRSVVAVGLPAVVDGHGGVESLADSRHRAELSRDCARRADKAKSMLSARAASIRLRELFLQPRGGGPPGRVVEGRTPTSVPTGTPARRVVSVAGCSAGTSPTGSLRCRTRAAGQWATTSANAAKVAFPSPDAGSWAYRLVHMPSPYSISSITRAARAFARNPRTRPAMLVAGVGRRRAQSHATPPTSSAATSAGSALAGTTQSLVEGGQTRAWPPSMVSTDPVAYALFIRKTYAAAASPGSPTRPVGS